MDTLSHTLVRIAAWYDIILGVMVFTISKNVFSLFNIPYPNDPLFLYASGYFVLAYGFLLLNVPLNNPNFKEIAGSSAFVRIAFFLTVITRFILHSNFKFGYFLLGLTDFSTAICLIIAIKKTQR